MKDKQMPSDKPHRPTKASLKPPSPHGMTPEEAIERAFGEKELPACPQCETPIKGFALISIDGEVLCPNCGSNVTNKNSI